MKAAERVVIAGGSGFLGLSLAGHLSELGYEPVLLSRSRPAVSIPWLHVKWDARSAGDWAGQLDGAAALVNLVGRSVDCIKTPDHCDEILRSRVEATLALGVGLRTVASPPPVWLDPCRGHEPALRPCDLRFEHDRRLHRQRAEPGV